MSESSELVPKNAQRLTATDDRPSVGDWFYVQVDFHVRFTKKGKSVTEREEVLACVSEVLSNSVKIGFVREGDDGEWNEQLSHQDWLVRSRPAPDWREKITGRMESLRLQMNEAIQAIRDEGVKKGAIEDASAHQPFDPSQSMLPAVRVLDPDVQKRGFIQLKENLEITTKRVDSLAKQYAMACKTLSFGELYRMKQTASELKVLENKIFTIEVYAGLQESVLQIAKGDPAPSSEKIAIMQSLRFMDEETLLEVFDGGMDFKNLSDFDEWVAEPQNRDRVLPFPKGIAAFKVRRYDKDYGPVATLWEAFMQTEWRQLNAATYLLIRNGDNLYRIASAVDFSPRLIPLRSEFDNAFIREKKWSTDPESFTVTPDHFEYDKYANKLRAHLQHYSRIVILIQGLLDRSEVFQPCLPVNLTKMGEFERTIEIVRDEEDVIAVTEDKQWSQYMAENRAGIKKGTWVWIGYPDRERGYRVNERPQIMKVEGLRKGRETDAFKVTKYHGSGKYTEYYEQPEKIIGQPGIVVSWPWGEVVDRWTGRYRDSDRRCRQWIPLRCVFNLEAYQAGDYAPFAQSRDQKKHYREWAKYCFKGEDWIAGRIDKREMSDEAE